MRLSQNRSVAMLHTPMKRRRSGPYSLGPTLTAGIVALFVLGSLGCKDLTGTQGLPSGTPNPSFYDDSSGAVGLRNAAIFAMDLAVPQYVTDVGLLTDELEDKQYHASTGTLLSNANAIVDPLDERILPEGVNAGISSYGDLQTLRADANLALHALVTYDTSAAAQATQHVLRGELYAMTGYAEIALADLFCSGVPLSTLDYHQDFTYAPSSRWDQVYQHANILLDSALQLSSGSDTVLNLARVLQGRAQLALGNYAAAADDVALVPTTFQYQLTFNYTLNNSLGGNFIDEYGTVADREGVNGFPYRSSGDPRTATVVICLPNDGACGGYSSPSDTLTLPVKYYTPGQYAPFVLANGIEARLIEAEANLHGVAGTTDWLTILNTLRESIQLPDTSDPGTAAGRVALLFHERAYWLFLTGHRQGDLRRLLRQYSQYPAFRSQSQVYPSGVYPAPGNGLYGDDFTVPIPMAEYSNPNYHGCLNRDDQ